MNDTIPEIRWMKEEERERREEGETVGKIFIWDIGRSVGRSRSVRAAGTTKATSSNFHFINGARAFSSEGK